MSKPTTTIKVYRDIAFEVEVTLEWQEDDDGVGSPSSTGNAMTGRRGDGRWVAVDVDIDVDSLCEAAKKAVSLDDDEVQTAAEEYTE